MSNDQTNIDAINAIASMHLGKAGDGTVVKPYVTPDNVDSSLLVPVPRYLNRTAYDIDDENLYGLLFIMDTDKKTIKLEARYQNLEDGPSVSDERNIETDRYVKEIFPKLIEDGIYPYAEVSFDGGGDDGYIHDEIIISSGDKAAKNLNEFPELNDLLHDMLSEYSGWEDNEGGYGKFLIDTRAGLVELTLTYNEYVDEDMLVGTFKYD